MFKFFRHIRQNMVYKNKISKYLLYAIGEIILVVIGILIALSINNWNIDRLNSKLEAEYCSRLIEDLKEDTAIIKAILKYNTQVIAHAKQVVKIFENSPDKNLNPIDNLVDFYQASQLQDPNTASSTYRELISSGQINLIKDKRLKTALIRYYEFDWSESDVFNLPNRYRERLRGQMPDTIQSQIRTTCDDRHIKVRETVEVILPDTCNFDMDKDYASQVVRELKKDEQLKKDLRYLMGNLRGIENSLISTKVQADHLIEQFESYNND